MTAREWLNVISQAADYPKHLTPLIEKYGEMLLAESNPVSQEAGEEYKQIIEILTETPGIEFDCSNYPVCLHRGTCKNDPENKCPNILGLIEKIKSAFSSQEAGEEKTVSQIWDDAITAYRETNDFSVKPNELLEVLKKKYLESYHKSSGEIEAILDFISEKYLDGNYTGTELYQKFLESNK